MAENVKIAEIDIGVDKITDKAGKARKAMYALRDTNKQLRKETNNLQNATKEQLNQFTQNEVAIKKYSKEVRDSQKVIDAYINIQNKDIRTKNDARDANRKLIAIANELDATNEDQAATLQKINAEIDKNTDFIKENASEYEKTKINIGNYKESIKEALGELGIFGKYQGDVNNIMKGSGPIITFVSTNLKQVKDDYKKAAAATTGMSKAQVAAHLTSTALAGGLKILKIALAATGIGLIVVALGSLIAYFASTQEGINKVNMVLTPLKEGFNAVLGSVQELGKALTKLFTLDFTGFLNDIKQIGDEMGNNIKEAVERGKEMERIQQNLNKNEADYITQQARLRKEFEQQKKLSDDTTKSTEEREKAAQRAIDLQAEISKGSIERIKQEAEILRLKQMSNDTSDAERAELATKLAEIDKALEEEAAKTTEAQNKLNSIRKEAAAKEEAEAKALAEKRKQYAEKVLQDRLGNMEQELALYREQNRLKQESDEQQLNFLQKNAAKELDILDVKLKNKLISETEYQTERLRLENDIAEKRAEMAQKDLDRVEEFETRKRELEDEIYFRNLESDEERERAKLEKEYEKKEAEIERTIEDAERRTELLVLLEEEKNLRLQEVNQKYEDKALNDERKRAEEEIKFREEVAQARVNIAQGLVGLLSAVAGENKKIQTAALLFERGVAASQVIINTQVANAKAIAASPLTGGQPWVTYNLVQMGLSLATIAAQTISGIKKINEDSGGSNTRTPRAAQGAILDINGKSHSQGGETFYDGSGNPIIEAQGGEKMVILKREASRELDVLSQLNQKHGGVPLSRPVSYAANGGAIIRNPQTASPVRIPRNLFDYNALGDVLADRVNAIVPVVPVDQVTNIAAKTARVERAADL